MYRWAADTTEEQKQPVAAALSELLAQIPEVLSFTIGPAALMEGNWDFGLVIDLADEAAWQRYIANPIHAEARYRDVYRPILADRAAVQFTVA